MAKPALMCTSQRCPLAKPLRQHRSDKSMGSFLTRPEQLSINLIPKKKEKYSGLCFYVWFVCVCFFFCFFFLVVFSSRPQQRLCTSQEQQPICI